MSSEPEICNALIDFKTNFLCPITAKCFEDKGHRGPHCVEIIATDGRAAHLWWKDKDDE
jgi:hypothetical protein